MLVEVANDRVQDGQVPPLPGRLRHSLHHLVPARIRGLPYIAGDPTAEEVLERVGIQRARALVCAVDFDALNVYITLTARALNADLVIVARASNPPRSTRWSGLGRIRWSLRIWLSGKRMAFLAQRPAVVDFLDLTSIVPDLRVERILVRAGSVLDSTRVAAASATYRDATILAIRRASGEPISYPGPEIGLDIGDRVVMLGSLPTSKPWGPRDLGGSNAWPRTGIRRKELTPRCRCHAPGRGQDQRRQVAGVGESSVGAVKQPG